MRVVVVTYQDSPQMIHTFLTSEGRQCLQDTPNRRGERNHKGNLDDRSLQVYLDKSFFGQKFIWTKVYLDKKSLFGQKAGSKTWINSSNVLMPEINLL